MCWRRLPLLLLLLLAIGDARGDAPPSAVLPSLRSYATGFFVDGAGHLLTARHAVETCRGLYLLRPGRVEPLTLVAADTVTDLALLQAAETLGQAGAFAGDPPPSSGETVFTASYVALLGADMDGVLANGIIAAQSRNVEALTFPISSAASSGTSGAPVVDGRGLVVGVVFARLQSSGTGRRRAGIAAPLLAVNAARAKAFLLGHGVLPLEAGQQPRSAGPSRAAAARAYTVGIGCAG